MVKHVTYFARSALAFTMAQYLVALFLFCTGAAGYRQRPQAAAKYVPRQTYKHVV
jgi:hypothetical protein